MSRDLKFRAWHKEQKKMFRVMSLRDFATTQPFKDLKYEDLEVMQFTFTFGT